MPITVQFDQPVGGRIPRALVYGGTVNVTSPSPTSVAFAMFARELIGDAFGGRNPVLARFDLPRPTTPRSSARSPHGSPNTPNPDVSSRHS